MHISPNGEASFTSVADAKKLLSSDLTKALASRFFSFRDTSHENVDAPDKRGFSITRDMLNGPAAVQNVQCLDSSHGLSAAGRSADVDSLRFFTEFDRLRVLGVVDANDRPNFDDDESIKTFFGRVYDKVHHEARKGRGKAKRIIDAAPSIYVFTELLKRSEVLIEEEFTELWARRVFPIRNLNTWMPQWNWKRKGRRGLLPNYVTPNRLPANAPRGSELIVPVMRPLVFFDHAASWTNLELLQHAEAVAQNGATNFRIDQERIDTAVQMMLMKEDLLAFFGDPDVDLWGLFSPVAKTGIERIPAGTQFGAGASTEDDRGLLTRETKQMILDTETKLQPNTIMLSTLTWLFVNDKRYGDVSADNNQTVLEAAQATLGKLGISDVMWVPEVGYSAKQAERLIAHGIENPGEAQRLAGGLDSKQTMVTMRRDPKVLELIVAQNRTMYPARSERNDQVEVRMLQGSGAMAIYQPEGIKITTDCGPDSL